MAYNPFTWQPGQPVPSDISGAAPEAPFSGSADLTNRLLQIMSGNLGGTLSSGEKLSALGALLKSVSRGSQTSPQQVMQNIQQQKMQQVQGALQVQELRKAAQRQAQTEGYRQQLVNAETDPKRKAFLQIADMDTINKIAAEQFTSKDNLDGIRAQLADLYGFGTPQYSQALKSYIERSQTFTGPGGAIYTQNPVNLPALSTGQAPGKIAPNRAEVLAELKKRGVI